MTNNNNPNNNKIEITGIVKDVLGSARFKVTLDDNGSAEGKILGGREIICTICGKMHQKRIRIVKGDKVKISILILSSDIADIKGVITFRLDN
jgi:translation initiation factor IF-1